MASKFQKNVEFDLQTGKFFERCPGRLDKLYDITSKTRVDTVEITTNLKIKKARFDKYWATIPTKVPPCTATIIA